MAQVSKWDEDNDRQKKDENKFASENLCKKNSRFFQLRCIGSELTVKMLIYLQFVAGRLASFSLVFIMI